MSVGILMLVHTAFDRAEQVARHWTKYGCPVVIHVDASVKPKAHKKFVKALEDVPDVRFCKRHKCEWGDWGLVAASQSAGETMLAEFPEVRHIYLSSGSCLPLRPVQELKDCPLYSSDAADERSSVDLGCRTLIPKNHTIVPINDTHIVPQTNPKNTTQRI